MHFSEIIKLQFGKKRHTLLCILLLFRISVAYLSLKNAWLPPIFFLDFNSRYQDLLFPHSDKPGENTSFLVGTVLNSNCMYNLPDVIDDISSSPLKDIWQPGDRQP